jgi:glycosyltransferase involved in cell wall biosynthesis
MEKFGSVRFVGWTHDLAACNPDYSFPHIDNEPWNLLKTANSHVEYVAISDLRRKQFLKLTGAAPRACSMIPNGIDPVEYLGLSAPVGKFVREHGVLQKDIILLHPTRILRRKNIELGIRVVAAMKSLGKNCCCIVTGTPDMFNADTASYYKGLLQLRRELAVEAEFIFLHELFAVANNDLIGLYRIGDVLFYPSKQEGFGLPVLEGALHGMPMFCADIEPMRSLAQRNVTLFDPATVPAVLAEKIAAHVADSVAIQSRKAMLRDYSWDALYPGRIEPLLTNQPHPI